MLNTRYDWDQWFDQIKSSASATGVWKYVDPEQSHQLSFNKELPTATSSTAAAETSIYNVLHSIYNQELKRLNDINQLVYRTTGETFKNFLLGKITTRERVLALRNAVQPSGRDIKQDIRSEFERLRKAPRENRTSVDTWLNQWAALSYRVATTAVEGLSESLLCDTFIEASVDVNQPFYNFMIAKRNGLDERISGFNHIKDMFKLIQDQMKSLTSSEETDTIRANQFSQQLQQFDDKIKTGYSTEALTINQCIQLYRSMEKTSITPRRVTSRAFVTLNNRKLPVNEDDAEDADDNHQPSNDDKTSKKTRKKEHSRKCICGKREDFVDCIYLNPEAVKLGQQLDPVKQAAVIRVITGNRSSARKVDATLRRAGYNKRYDWWPSSDKPTAANFAKTSNLTSGSSPFSSASFTTSLSTAATMLADMRDTWILDNGSDGHVCNNMSMLKGFKPAQETVAFGNSSSSINGYGQITLIVETNQGPGLLHLDKVAYVPGFHTNLVSADLLEQENLYFNTRLCRIEGDDPGTWIQLQKLGGFRAFKQHLSMATATSRQNSNRASKKR